MTFTKEKHSSLSYKNYQLTNKGKMIVYIKINDLHETVFSRITRLKIQISVARDWSVLRNKINQLFFFYDINKPMNNCQLGSKATKNILFGARFFDTLLFTRIIFFLNTDAK